ncbi:hypothetical protein Tco_1355872, partial [Tanacetum coccineum]
MGLFRIANMDLLVYEVGLRHVFKGKRINVNTNSIKSVYNIFLTIFSSPPITTIPDTQPTLPPSPQIPSPPYNDTEGPSFEPSYHMSPPPSHEPKIQTSRTSEESEQLRNLLDLIPRLESRVESLEKELSDTKQTLGTAVL